MRRHSLKANPLVSVLSVLVLAPLLLLPFALTTGCNGEKDPDSQRFLVTIEHTGTVYDLVESGIFDTPTGETAPAPLFPGDSYEFTVHAAPGHRLSFATMMVQSNDLFYAPDGQGIALFNENDQPVTGDVTDQVLLWDAGTEIDQEPGVGADQAPRQAAPGAGDPDTDDEVAEATDDFLNLPLVSEVISVDVTHEADDLFTITITNVSDASTLQHSEGESPVPLSPGVFVVHREDNPLFEPGYPDADVGLEALAEDGDPAPLAQTVTARTGLNTPLSPGFWIVQPEPYALFEPGEPVAGFGLEDLAEDGDPSSLAETLAEFHSGVFDTPVNAVNSGPLHSGEVYTFEIEGEPQDRLFFATMVVESNDLFLAPDGEGIALFDENDEPITGEVTNRLMIWDAGTEINQYPGTGTDQPLRQEGFDTGEDEGGVVQVVDDVFGYPPVGELVRVTVDVVE